MTISEKSAYLKGLMDGLKLDTESPEGQMIKAMVDLLGDLAKKVTDIEDTTIAISDELDEIEEDLDSIEDYILDDEDEEDDEAYDEDEEAWDDEDYSDEDEPDEGEGEDDDEEEGIDIGDDTVYEVECSCGNILNFDEQTLQKGNIVCPRCGETLEFDFGDEE